MELSYHCHTIQVFEEIVDLLDPEMNMGSDDEDEEDENDLLDDSIHPEQSYQPSQLEVPPQPTAGTDTKATE